MTTDIVVYVPRFTFAVIFYYIIVDSRNNILKIFSFFLNIYIFLSTFINVKKYKLFTCGTILKTKLIYRVEKLNKTYIRLF